MERIPYYVSVQARTILANQGDASYELEIEATPEEVDQLFELFHASEDLDLASMFRAPLSSIPYHHDKVNDQNDDCLRLIYQSLFNLGTRQTKEHILTMNILQ